MANDQFSFEPRGLSGWLVSFERDRFGARWVFSTPADFPRAFDWCETARDHIIPICDDRRGPFSGAECKTAKQAVAAAHRHNRAIVDHIAAKRLTA